MSDTADSPEGPASPTDGQPPNAAALRARVATPPRRRSVWRWLWLPALLLVVAAALWFRYGRELGMHPLASVETSAAAPVAANAEVEALRRALDDAARVNRAMREQLLGLTQRVGLLEDGLSGFERGAAPGIDAVRLAEADFLLRLGEERLRLFTDVAGARAAFELADAQLSEVGDPRVASVRQTLALERDALAAVAVADLPVILARLDALANGVADWPLRGRDDPAAAQGAAAAPPGIWQRLTTAIDRYFRVRRIDPSERSGAGPLLRERIALDLSRARLLLLRAQGEPALAAIQSVRSEVAREFDETDARVASALGVLDEIRSSPLVPQWPDLSESRRELARLRGAAAATSLQPAAAPGVDHAAAAAASGTPDAAPEAATLPAELAPTEGPTATPDATPGSGDEMIDRSDIEAAQPEPDATADPDRPAADGD
jgi:uroporphyrin-3 C-methyltransferase